MSKDEKFTTIGPLRREVDRWLSLVKEVGRPLLSQDLVTLRTSIMLKGLRGMASYQGHSPTWAKELLRMYE